MSDTSKPFSVSPSVPVPTEPAVQGGAGRPIRARLHALRPIHVALIVLGLALFLALSAMLARFLSTENVERDDLLALLQAEASGNERGMLARLSDCGADPACRASVRANAAALRRPGSVKILSLTSHTAYSLTGATAPTRVAWTVIGRLPKVQCVRVRRTGDFISGVSVTLLSLSAPIPNEGDC